MNIFISYTSRDLQPASALRDRLQLDGFDCWMAPESIPPGSNYPQEIEGAISQCDCLVLVLSRNLSHSTFVCKEVIQALNAGKMIVPFHLDHAEPPKGFGFLLNNVQRIEACGRTEEAYCELSDFLLHGKRPNPPMPGKRRRRPFIAAALAAVACMICAALLVLLRPALYDIEIHADETCTIVKYRGNDTSIVIPATIDGYRVAHIGAKVFAGSEVEEITLPDGLETLGRECFYNSRLLRITLPDGLSVIGNWAFASCKQLESVAMPDGLLTIGNSAFAYCSALKDVVLPDLLEIIGDEAFAHYDSLERIDLPRQLKSIGYSAFFSCDSLRDVTFPAEPIKIGSAAFSCCDMLSDSLLPDSSISVPDSLDMIEAAF